MERQSGYYWITILGKNHIAEYDQDTKTWRGVGGYGESTSDAKINEHCTFVGTTPIEFDQTVEDFPLRKELVMKFIESGGRAVDVKEFNETLEYIKTGK